MLFSVFIFGFLSALLALILELVLIPPETFPEMTALTWSLGAVLILTLIALIEETCKYLLLTQYFIRFSRERLLVTSQKIFLGFVFGLGFASLELALAYYNTLLFTFNSGLLGIIFLHSMTTLTLIFLPAWFRDTKTKILLPLGTAITLHLCYNVLLSFVLA